MCRLSSRLNPFRKPLCFVGAAATVALTAGAIFAAGVAFAVTFFVGFFVVAMMVMVNDKWWVVNSILSYN